jgi:uncharacterized coiled-coil protein SlyX
MKTKIFFSALILFVASPVFYAQSDYEKMQNFKNQYKQIEESIKNAGSVNDCKDIGDQIEKLKNDFSDSRAMLDKALYPENFESSIAKIENSLEMRSNDFNQISDLHTQVDTLKTHVSDLNQKNDELIKQITELNDRSTKNEAAIARLNKLVAELRSNIQQRDLLVRDLVDSLLVQFIKPASSMNQAEKQSVMSKVKSGNLFYNVERTIADNIQFIKITYMTPQDFSNMKQQYRDFNKVWNQIGPKLGSVYLNKKDKKSEIASIDSLFGEWNNQMNNEMWGNINSLFNEKGINLQPFNNGDQFAASVNSFIDDEIKNIGAKSKEESENTYKAFSDSVYYQTVKPEWVPVLLANNMMTQANQETIELKIAFWKKEVSPSSSVIIYIALGFVLVGIIIYFFLRRNMKTIKVAQHV